MTPDAKPTTATCPVCRTQQPVRLSRHEGRTRLVRHPAGDLEPSCTGTGAEVGK